jgi:hypothetical protein
VWWFINETVVQFFLSVFPSRSQSTSTPEGKSRGNNNIGAEGWRLRVGYIPDITLKDLRREHIITDFAEQEE